MTTSRKDSVILGLVNTTPLMVTGVVLALFLPHPMHVNRNATNTTTKPEVLDIACSQANPCGFAESIQTLDTVARLVQHLDGAGAKTPRVPSCIPRRNLALCKQETDSVIDRFLSPPRSTLADRSHVLRPLLDLPCPAASLAVPGSSQPSSRRALAESSGDRRLPSRGRGRGGDAIDLSFLWPPIVWAAGWHSGRLQQGSLLFGSHRQRSQLRLSWDRKNTERGVVTGGWPLSPGRARAGGCVEAA